MWAVSSALNNIAATKAAKAQRDADERQREADAQAEADQKEAGVAKAAEKNVTGAVDNDWLTAASDTARDSYMETDGINAVDRFHTSIQADLAKMPPGANIDDFLRVSSGEFIQTSGLQGKAKDAFVVGLSREQDSIKQKYLKQSIAESMKREEEGAGSLLVTGMTKGNMLSPEGYATWRAYNAGKGMSDEDLDTITVNAVKAALAAGDVDTVKAMALLQTPSAPGRPVLADVPEHKEELQLAAKRGETVREEKAQKERYDAEIADTVQVDALADKGILGTARATAWGKANNKTAAEVAAKVNSSREAQERLAAKTAKAQKERGADLRWRNHDAITENRDGFTPDDIGKAGDRAFTAALQSGDDSRIQSVLDHSARTGAPIPALKGILTDSIDENDPQRASKYVAIYERMQNISPEWAARQLDDKTLARVTQYQTEKMLGASDAQAWSRVKMGTNLDTETIHKNVTEAMKLVAKDAPTEFPSEHFWQSDTPIANQSELDTAYRLSVKSMVQAGASPEVAAKSALARVKSSYIRVGDRMVRSYGTGDGLGEQTSAAMTEASVMWKDKLVASNTVGKDDPVWFVPVPGSENKWRLKYFAAGGVPLDVTHEVTKVGADGKEHTTTEFVDVIPSAARANYTAWKKQEDDKKVRNAQTFKATGYDPEDLTPDAVARLDKLLAIQGKPLDPNDQTPYAKDPANIARRAEATKLRGYVTDPANQLQSFADFITANH
ncbi:MAG: hypothetical protein ACYC0F_09305 [Rhodanobacter sp.]